MQQHCFEQQPFLSTTLPKGSQQMQQQLQLQHEAFYSTTLPKAPLKGILKNSNQNGTSCSTMHLDVIPFDTVPPCDDCMNKARVQGSYTGDCQKQECAMGSLRRKSRAEKQIKRKNSTRSLRSFQCEEADQEGGFLASTAFRGSQESLLSNIGDKEVLENVESSV